MLPLALPEVDVWAALHTKARCEKVVNDYLHALQVPVFLPLATNRRVYGQRIRVSRLPLFPGYVFFDPTVIENKRVFECRKVAQVLNPTDPGELKRDLESLFRVLSVDDRARRIDKYPPGTPVEVVAGPMKGVTGTLVRIDDETRLVIRVHFIGAAAELVIDEAFVRPL